jgi:propionyl-CoA carboxylase alpha chain
VSSACSRLLVVNRGEIARRVFRTAHAMGIDTVAVYADPDAAAPFVREAGRSVALGGSTATETYLSVGKLLDAARRSGADAVHPGYGFLSENAAFARAVADAGLTWVGPPPDAIAAMGDKLAAKEKMARAGVPTLASLPVADGADLAALADQVRLPALVKAAAGGGGKGMRIVTDGATLPDAVASARREAASAFGDDTVFLERYLPVARHVEIQVLGDQHGYLVHCFERECSIQRRHQKIIEEAPSPALTEALRARMGEAAVAAAAAIGYHSAGTVEFMLTGEGDDAEFFFLEVNTRLQVEHPVTEEITGLDLVREQIRIARGEPLGYGQTDLSRRGHAIEARIYAEDPANDFLPATGTLTAWEPAPAPAVRLDSGVETGSVVGVEFDPMLAKVVAHAATRDEAALALALALERMTIAGVVTNRDFLVNTLRSPAFLAGDTTTDFIDRVDPPRRRPAGDDEVARSAVAAAMARSAANRAATRELSFLPAAYRNSVMPPERVIFTHGDADVVVAYQHRRGGSFAVRVDDGAGRVLLDASLTVHDCEPATGCVDVAVDGLRASYRAVRSGLRWTVQGPGGGIDLVELPRFRDPSELDVAGGQTAPMPGKILAVHVQEGDQVTDGQALVVLEAMKMEHTIHAPAGGMVTEVRCAVGDQVDNGQVLVVISV